MSVTINYILEQEKLKKQQEQETVPGIEPQQQENFEEEFPNVNRVVAPQNKSALPPFSRGVAEVMNERARQPQQQIEPQAQIEQPQQPISMKPEHWSDDEYNAVKQLYSDEQIQSMFSNPDPNELLNGIISNIYKANTPEPKLPDEKQMAKQRKYAAIGDALSLFSQAAGASQGAYVRERKFEEGAMGRLSENQQKLYDRYLQRADQYSRGLVNAQMQDYLQGHKNWKETENDMRKTLAAYRKEKIDAAKQAQKDAIEREKLDNANRKLDAYIKDSDRRLTIAEQNARTAAARAEGYNKRAEAWVRKLEDERANPSSGNNIKRHDYEIMIPAHPDDPDAFENDDGELVTIVGTSRAEKDYLIKQAMEDEEFIASIEESNRALAGAARRGDLSVSQRNLLADYYLQRRYNNQFVASGEGEIDPLVRMGAVGGAVGRQSTRDAYTEVVRDEEFMGYVKRRNKDMHNAIKEGGVTTRDEREYIVGIYDEWLENGRQDPVETTIQQVQDAEDEMNPNDEFKIVGTI